MHMYVYTKNIYIYTYIHVYRYAEYTTRIPIVLVYEVDIRSCRMSTISNMDGRSVLRMDRQVLSTTPCPPGLIARDIDRRSCKHNDPDYDFYVLESLLRWAF